LTGLHTLIDRSFAAVRLEVGVRAAEAVAVHAVIEEVVVGATLLAQSKGISLRVSSVDENVVVVADWQILAAAVTNLLHNAFKFTLAGTPVLLNVSATTTRVLIEVEDECGGLPPGRAGSLLRPFVQRGVDRSGLGLGLSICVKAVQAMNGELRVRDLPGKGCVFTLDLPRKGAAASYSVEPLAAVGSSTGGSGQFVLSASLVSPVFPQD
jgi:signal transduction histidine kinase